MFKMVWVCVAHEDRLPEYLLEWHPRHGKRTRERKRTTWLSCIEEDLEMVTGRVGIDSLNRSSWRAMLQKACEVVVEQPNSHNDDGQSLSKTSKYVVTATLPFVNTNLGV